MLVIIYYKKQKFSIMKKVILSVFSLILLTNLSAQKYFSKDAKINFSATSSLEKIEANNNKGTLVIDAASSKLEAAVLVKGFHFEKALMEEHFNENYMESGKFSKATFAGEITDMKTVNMAKDGDYKVNVKGKLTMHGVTKDITTTATITVKGGAVTGGKTSFKVLVGDYGIAIPGAVKDKIAKEAKIDVEANLQKMK
jgi:polyisoprenoid-binding protein YceI